MPASRMTWRPPRSRTWSTRATSQPARATSARPGSIARRVGSPFLGDRLEQRPGARGRSAPGSGDGSSVGTDREPAAEVDRVERLDRAAPQRGQRERLADRVAPGVDRTELRPDVEVDAARAERAVGPATGLDRRPDLGLGHAELGGPGPDGEARHASRARRPGSAGTGRRRAAPAFLVRRTATASASASSGDSSAIQRSGAPAAAARAAARRSAGVLPTPSSVIRSFGTPARRASAHSPRETTFAPNPRAATARDHGRDIVRLDRVLPDDRVRKRGRRRPRTRRRGREVGDEERRPESPRRRAERRRDRACSVGDAKPDDGPSDGQGDGPDDRGDDRVDLNRSGGKSPTVNGKPKRSDTQAVSSSSPPLMRKPEEAERHHAVGRASSLTIGPMRPLTTPKMSAMTISAGIPPS